MAGSHLSGTAPESLEVEVHLPGLPTLIGTVAGVRGNVIQVVTYRDAARARLSAWLRLLALSATYPEVPFEAQTIGGRARATVVPYRWPPIGPLARIRSRAGGARAHLADLVGLFQRGMCEPLPLFCKTSAAYARPGSRQGTGRGARAGPRPGWESGTTATTRTGTRSTCSCWEMSSRSRTCSGDGEPRDGRGRRPRPLASHRFGVYARRSGTAAGPREGAGSSDGAPPHGGGDGGRRDAVVRGPRSAAAGHGALQASAGTGKTFTIAALTARYVAEGTCRSTACSSSPSPAWPRASSASRCGTVWSRAFDGLADVLAGREPQEDDESCGSWPTCRAPRWRPRRGRLGKAIADFDAATIETTHGFCLQVLYGLGTAGDVDRDVTLVEDVQRPRGRGRRRPLPAQVRPSAEHARLHREEAGRSPARSLDLADAFDRAALVRRGRTRRHPPPIRRGGAQGDGGAQAGAEDPHLRRCAAAAPRHPRRSRSAAPRLRPSARALRCRAGRRVPGHRPRAVGHHAWCLRRRRHDARAHRRPQAGDLRLPRRRRARLPPGAGDACSPSGRSTSTGAATRACSRPTTRSSGTRSSDTRASPTATSGLRRRERQAELVGHPVPRRCGSASCTTADGLVPV